MKEPLFFVKCPTCETQIPFEDETQLGLIIPCPRCGCMVLVQKSQAEIQEGSENFTRTEDEETLNENRTENRSENTAAEKNVQIPESVTPTARKVLPPAPPVSLTPSDSSATSNYAESQVAPNSPNSLNLSNSSNTPNTLTLEESDDSEFVFEGESPAPLSRKTLILGMSGIAAGIFLLGIILFFVLFSSPKNNSVTALKVPEKTQSYEEFTAQKSKQKKDAAQTSETDVQTDSDAETDAQTDADSGAESGVKNRKSEETATENETEEFPEEGDGSISTLVQSDVGKLLSDHLAPDSSGETKLPTSAAPEISDEETGTEIEATGDSNGKSNSPSDGESNGVSDGTSNGDSDGASNGVSDGVSDGESAADPDSLQFDRRKRSRVYAGEDPVLNFDTISTPPETPKDASSEAAAPHPTKEPAANVATPTDETVSETAPPPQFRPVRLAPPQVEFLPMEIAQKLNFPLEKISIAKKPVISLIQFASQSSGVRITLDWQRLQSLGVSSAAPVSLELTNTTVREALDTGLNQAGLGVISGGSALKVVGADAAFIVREAAAKGEKPIKHILELEDLASTYATETSGQSGLGEIAKMIPMFVHPAIWESANGPGKITPNPKKSRISLQQYPSVIQEVELFCDKIRHARNMEMKNLPTRAGERRSELIDGTEICDTEITPRYALSEPVRRTPIDCDLSNGTTLRQALNEIMRCANAKLIIDEAAVACVPISAVIKDADVPDFEGNRPKLPDSILDLPCIHRFEGIAMEEAVSDVLKSVPLFCYPIGKDAFFLTTFQEAEKKMLLDFYPVGDIIHNPAAAGTVLNGICSTIQPQSWVRSGGSGNIYFDIPSKSLIVRQNPFVLFNIEMFLKKYRDTQNPGAKMDAKQE